MVTLVGIKLVFIGMQIIFSTSEINSEIEQMEIFVAAKMPYFVTSRHSLHQKYACSVDIDLSQSSIYPRKSQISWHFIIPLNP